MPTIGILGGGQLAKMTAHAAARLGVRVRFLDRDLLPEGGPTSCWDVVKGDWDDPDTLLGFAQTVDIMTLENEFVDANTLQAAEDAGHTIYPTAHTVRTIQDKFAQKSTLRDAGLGVPEFVEVPHPEDLPGIGQHFGYPLILKQRRDGYDGKGNATVASLKEAESAFTALSAHRQVMAEIVCRFDRELAVMVTRSIDGSCVTYPVVETIQKEHICHVVKAPAGLTVDRAMEIREHAVKAVEAFEGIGTFGVELFEMEDGEVLINEMAPRVHNSGHYSIEACYCSQYENHIRAILGWPLGSTGMIQPAAVMVNLLGIGDGTDKPEGLKKALAVPGANIHIYGKAGSRNGRKMGHVTALGDTIEEAEATAMEAAHDLRFGKPAATLEPHVGE